MTGMGSRGSYTRHRHPPPPPARVHPPPFRHPPLFRAFSQPNACLTGMGRDSALRGSRAGAKPLRARARLTAPPAGSPAAPPRALPGSAAHPRPPRGPQLSRRRGTAAQHQRRPPPQPCFVSMKGRRGCWPKRLPAPGYRWPSCRGGFPLGLATRCPARYRTSGGPVGRVRVSMRCPWCRSARCGRSKASNLLVQRSRHLSCTACSAWEP